MKPGPAAQLRQPNAKGFPLTNSGEAATRYKTYNQRYPSFF